MLYDAYEPDFYEEDEEIINIYNEHFEVLFVDCDKRVIFTEREELRLNEYLEEINPYLNELEESRYALFELGPGDIGYEDYLEKFKHSTTNIIRIRRSSEKIRERAERRYMKQTFRHDIDLIVNDALNTFKLVLNYTNKYKLHSDFFKMNANPSDYTRAYILSFLHAIPMHFNYLCETGKLEEFINRFYSISSKGSNKSDDLEYRELLNKIVNEYMKVNNKGYEITRYGPPLGNFSMLSSKSISRNGKSFTYLKVEKKGLIVEINIRESYNDEITQSMHQLLDYIILLFNRGGCHDYDIVIDIGEYTKLRSLESETKIASQVKESLEKLNNIKMSYSKVKIGNKKEKYNYNMKEVKIIDEIAKKRNGRIKVKLTKKFADSIAGFPIMQYSMKLFEFNEKENPHSYYLLKRLLWHRHINHKHRNTTIISVKSLLYACPNLPDYDSIVKSGQIRQRIIDPFERDLDVLSDVFTWKYKYMKKYICAEESQIINYDTFIKCMLHIEWVDYPVERIKQP